MNVSTVLSPAQCIGYIALVLGISAFLQKDDRRLKFLNATQSLVYMVHFALLGRYSASASGLVAGTRSYLSLKTRSPWVAALMIALGAGLGGYLARDAYGYLPVLSTCLATTAVFFMRGVRMRLVLLVCTLLWLVNNLHSGSIGGSVLECFVATANSVTMIRIHRSNRRKRLATRVAQARQNAPGKPVMVMTESVRH